MPEELSNESYSRRSILAAGVASLTYLAYPNNAKASGSATPTTDTPVYVNVKDFGATGTSSPSNPLHDDSGKIQDAIDYLECQGKGGAVFLPAGVYVLRSPLVVNRGIRLLGEASFDETYEGSVLILGDGANCEMLKVTDVTGNYARYLIIENLLFDGNYGNQTVENTAITLNRVYIGSYIRNVSIRNVLGKALQLSGGVDINIDMLWVNRCVTSDYAITINHDYIGGSQIAGLVNLDNIYVENISNVVGGTPRFTPAHRGKGILFAHVAKVNITDIHFEGLAYPMDVATNISFRVNSVSSNWMGNDNTDSSLVRMLDYSTRRIYLGSGYTRGMTDSFRWLAKEASLPNHNSMPESGLCKDIPELSGIDVVNYSNFMNKVQQETDFVNGLNVLQVGGFASPRIIIDSTSSKRHFMQSRGGYFDIGVLDHDDPTKDNISITLNQFGNAGNSITLGDPVYLASRPHGGNLGNGALMLVNGNPYLTRGSNVIDPVVTSVIENSAPSNTPDYIGQMYIDKANKQAYVAVGDTSSNDWKQITS